MEVGKHRIDSETARGSSVVVSKDAREKGRERCCERMYRNQLLVLKLDLIQRRVNKKKNS